MHSRCRLCHPCRLCQRRLSLLSCTYSPSITIITTGTGRTTGITTTTGIRGISEISNLKFEISFACPEQGLHAA